MKSVNNVTISLGKPITAAVLIPVLHSATPSCIHEPFMVNGEIYYVTCVSFGTPHGAVLMNDIEDIDVAHLGHLLGTHARFPEGASIVFIQVLDNSHIRARLWQRGEGEIAFTKEAVCVVMSAAKILQKIMWDADISMGGNTFHVKWDHINDDAYITGATDLLQATAK